MVESLLIAVAGGLLGAAIAAATFQSLVTMVLSAVPARMPAIRIDASPDLSVFGFAFALTLVTSLGFGLAPALQAAKADLASGMKQDSAGSGRRTTGLLRGALVAVQVAVCMLLLIVAGLLLRGLYSAQTIDPGFEYRTVAQISYDMRSAGFYEERARQFQTALFDALRGIPGVDAIAFTETTPLSMESHTEMFAPEGMAPRSVNVNSVSPEYFGLIGTPVVLGSNFTGREREGSNVVIVTESTARLFWPGRNPVGQVLRHLVGPGPRFEPLTVAGVVRDAQLTQVGSVEDPFLYVPAGAATPLREQLVVRTQVNVNEISTAIRERVRKLDPAMVVRVAPLEENLALWRTMARLIAGLSGSLSGLGLVLASIGVYGVVSYSVSRRLREVGIRMALGASAAEVRSIILKQSMRPVLAGAAAGLMLAAGVARILQSVLFGVSTYDPVAFIGAPLVLITVAAAASMVPIRRAMRVDPMTALRYE
jgi:predicted permease